MTSLDVYSLSSDVLAKCCEYKNKQIRSAIILSLNILI